MVNKIGVLILQEGVLVYANSAAAELLSCSQDELVALMSANILAWAHSDDLQRLQTSFEILSVGASPKPQFGVRVNPDYKDGYIDCYLSPTIFNRKAAIEMLWQENDPQNDRRSRVEANVMQDILVALAGAANMQQALEIILMNLHNLIQYDRVGLFLSDESQRLLLSSISPSDANSTLGITSQDHPLVAEFQRSGKPIVVTDVQEDSRFSNWKDMKAIRGWLGAPLLAGENVIGFLSMGSLIPGAYGNLDIEIMETFAAGIAEVLEKAWTYEQSRRRTEQLEVLSNITFALGRAERRADTLSAIVSEIVNYFGAQQCVFLQADPAGLKMLVRVAPDESLVGITHPRGDDLLWQIFDQRQTSVIMEVPGFLQVQPDDLFKRVFSNVGAAAVMPLIYEERVFGVLCLLFKQARRFSFEDIRLYDMIAEIAGASLHRAVSLETLERQVNIRTSHLSTLYEINAVTGDPEELDRALKSILEIVLKAMGARAGAIHRINDEDSELYLSVQLGLPTDYLSELSSLPLMNREWHDLVYSDEPVVAPQVDKEKRLPALLQVSLPNYHPTYIGAPIRVENRILGLLSIFGANVLEDAIENLALLMTIADQIGGFLERASLIQRAEHAAVIEERQRLARELHDSVTQLLYSQVLFSGAGAKVLLQGNPVLAGQHLEQIHEAALQALKEMRLLVYELRPETDTNLGLIPTLEHRLDSVERRTGVEVHLEAPDELGLDYDKQLALIRVIEEALNNTIKHAQAQTVRVKLFREEHQITIEVEDDGCGFKPQQAIEQGGMGIDSMRTRVAELGGVFKIESAPGEGTKVSVIIAVEE